MDRAGNETFFVDGEEDARFLSSQAGGAAIALSLKTREPLLVGAGLGAAQNRRPFQGFIRDVRLWNHTRTHDDLRRDYATPLAAGQAGLVGHWPLERHLRDSAGSHDGGLVGNASLVAGAAAIEQTQICFSTNHRAPLELDRSRSKPLINIATCLDGEYQGSDRCEQGVPAAKLDGLPR